LAGSEPATVPASGKVQVGINHLNGDAALAFVRERHQLSEGDIFRGRRQQVVNDAQMARLSEALGSDDMSNISLGTQMP